MVGLRVRTLVPTQHLHHRHRHRHQYHRRRRHHHRHCTRASTLLVRWHLLQAPASAAILRQNLKNSALTQHNPPARPLAYAKARLPTAQQISHHAKPSAASQCGDVSTAHAWSIWQKLGSLSSRARISVDRLRPRSSTNRSLSHGGFQIRVTNRSSLLGLSTTAGSIWPHAQWKPARQMCRCGLPPTILTIGQTARGRPRGRICYGARKRPAFCRSLRFPRACLVN
jgi:hypothetical protein